MVATATETYQHILVATDGPVATITMNRPERRNALSLAHMEELIHCFKAVGQNATAAVVILRGNGPAFCAGHDLGEIVGVGHGIATAAGCQLVATCDLAVAAEEARFATPGVKIGLFCSTPMVALSRAVSRKKAMEMLLTGDLIPAREALVAGLVNSVVPAAELESATHALAAKIAAASQLVVGIGKQAFYRQLEMPQHQAYDYAMEVMSFNATFADAQEGMCAFLEKRQPQWKGR